MSLLYFPEILSHLCIPGPHHIKGGFIWEPLGLPSSSVTELIYTLGEKAAS